MDTHTSTNRNCCNSICIPSIIPSTFGGLACSLMGTIAGALISASLSAKHPTALTIMLGGTFGGMLIGLTTPPLLLLIAKKYENNSE